MMVSYGKDLRYEPAVGPVLGMDRQEQKKKLV